MDNYIGFTYNNKRLGFDDGSDFSGFIVNSSDDLRFSNAPNFSNNFTEVPFGERTYFSGVTKTNKTFNFNIQLDKILLSEYRDFLEWLSPDSSGTLSFDYNPNYGYEVKLNSLTEGEFQVVKTADHNEDFYYVSLSLSFITLHDFAAKWIETDVFYPSGSLIDNEEDLNFISVNSNNYTFYNYHNLKNYFTIEFDTSLLIKEGAGEDQVELVNITNAGDNAIFYSEYGMALKADGSFLSCGPNPKITLESNASRTFEITTTGDINKIYPTSREIL